MKEVAGAGTKMGLQINFFVQRTIGVAWTGFRIILEDEREIEKRPKGRNCTGRCISSGNLTYRACARGKAARD